MSRAAPAVAPPIVEPAALPAPSSAGSSSTASASAAGSSASGSATAGSAAVTGPGASPAEPRPGPLAVWLSATRPRTLLASVAPVLAGTALAAREVEVRALPALAALAGALLIQVGTNLHNDAADFERGADTAERVGPARATQRGWLSRRQVLGAAAAAFALAVVPGAYLVAQGGWPILALGLCSLLAGWLYTGGPWPLAYLGLGELFVLAFFGVGAVGGSWLVQTGGARAPSTELLAGGLAIGSFASAILAVNNLRDRAGDARAGKRTLAVRLGERFARAEHAALLLAPFALAAACALARPVAWGAALCALPLALLELRATRRADGAALNARLGGAARVELAFAALLAAGVLVEGRLA